MEDMVRGGGRMVVVQRSSGWKAAQRRSVGKAGEGGGLGGGTTGAAAVAAAVAAVGSPPCPSVSSHLR